MTEIPEHLLARSKARRQAIGQAEGDAAPSAEAPSTSGAVEPAAASPAAPAGPAAPAAPSPAKAPAPPAPPPPPPPRPEVAAAQARKKIPWWAVPAVAGLPVWAGIYAFTLEPPADEGLLATEGAELYRANCASCHGATGGGGVGPAFTGGAVVETFPEYADHIQWVSIGTQGWQAEVGPTYGAQEKPAGGVGIMPAFESSLSEEQIALVVRYEREVLAGGECEPELAELTGEACE